MPETQNIEYKSSWHEEYLDWICGFANAQELTGTALNEFLLERIGKKWDSVPVPNVQAEDLKPETFTFFKEKGIKSGRLDEDSRNDNPVQVIENLATPQS